MPPEASPGEPPGDDERMILIVEDNDTNALILGAMLRKHGYRTAVATDGALGVEMTRDLAPSLVLMDLHMPKMDGFAAIERLREEGSGPPVVAVTANASPEVHAACLRCGFRAVLSKPVVLVDLIDVVRRFMPAT